MTRCLLLAGLLLYFVPANAEPMYQANPKEGVRVVLYSEACELKEVANLPRRATWEEGGKTFEGCWGARPDAGLVVLYFTDKTIGLAPIQVFQRVLGV